MSVPHEVLQDRMGPFREGRIALPEGEPSRPKPRGAGSTSLRRSVHRGRTIEIHTTYQVCIDGRPIDARVSVHPNGRVHCNGLPNYSFTSAVELAQALIDGPAEAETVDELNAPSHEELERGGEVA